MHQWVSRALFLLLLVSGVGLVTASPVPAAAPGRCHWQTVLVTDAGVQGVQYQRTQVCPVGVTPGVQPVRTKGARLCDIKSAPPATFCWGTSACYIKDSVVPYLPPTSPEPTPGAAWQVRMCFPPGQLVGAPTGTALWVGQAPQPPSQLDQSLEATGQIRMPSAVLSFNPTARTLVNLDTWFWAQGLKVRDLKGTGAFGLVAVATPDRLEVTPGDGSAMPPCPWVTMKPQVQTDQRGPCSHAYVRSSIGGSARGPKGAPAYRASARAVWKLRFELNGEPVVIPGAQSELTGPEMTAPVVVVEVQTIVTGTG